MKSRLLFLMLTVFLVSGFASASGASAPAAHTFRVEGNQFVMDGKPYQIISGEMHFARVPRAYWRDRLRMARAMGLNTITTYVFWNVHEPRPGVYDFSGQYDVAEYIREAQQEGLNVILRPGPYACAEWDLGGYPSWLLKDRSVVLRSLEPHYTAAVTKWLARLGKEIQPLLLKNGGPIIAVQVENEYGSFGEDHAYMEAVKAALVSSGMGADVLYTADGADEVPRGSLPELPAVINFGEGGARSGFATLAKIRPDGPRMSGEYWGGWFDHWGEKHHVTSASAQAAELGWMLNQGYSVSIYMFHGGTSFGWMNGANSDGKNYEPDTTSYDYDAPLDEQGAPREKYFLFRDAIAKATGKQPPAVPAAIPLRTYKIADRYESASLWSNLPDPVSSTTLLTMEDLDQSYGYILYRTKIEAGAAAELAIDGLHDYAQIYVDQKLIGSLDRRVGTSRLTLPAQAKTATLDILVENSGRVNFTAVIRGERKGITGAVSLGGKRLENWHIYSLPMDNTQKLKFSAGPCEGPCFYRTIMPADGAADTYFDTQAIRKGFVWLNDRPLGRSWFVGPQHTLYVPGVWLTAGENRIVFFDLMGSAGDRIESVSKPVFDMGPAK